MTNADYIRSIADEELAKQLIYMAYFDEGYYDWEEEYIEYWNSYYVCSDGERFRNENNAIKHELEWLRLPHKEEK